MGKATLVLEIDGWDDARVRDVLLETARTLDRVAKDVGTVVQRVYVEAGERSQSRRRP